MLQKKKNINDVVYVGKHFYFIIHEAKERVKD